ncbi:prepilin-type N-terminal cleavage/methylation domain-containing protein [Halobacillus halophilus]|uniref:prepilin-type N-terminal cleavage/methylation domain-containing protein n=1 Tax=Halobacillus halophilus TaxID=1570 RepID=UPI001CD366F7|nr:prepilin-type N-terminal cleavage/methylation domain-containing protein [Halobacillus halophilus]MCA1009669.1 prepilin-type N-terminal cleavage/methylation domain-containing protein [Halobacillus halophilus]
MRNSSGFTLIETITALSLLLCLIIFLLPSLSHIRLLQKDLAHERIAISYLHEELHALSYSKPTLPIVHLGYQEIPLQIQFVEKSNLVEGCITWKTHLKKIEEVCLYAKSS